MTLGLVIDACTQDYGSHLDRTVFDSLLKACSKAERELKAAYWLQRMAKQGITPNTTDFNIMVHVCAKTGHYDDAES